MMDLERLKREVLRECKEDHVGLWSIIWQLRYALNDGNYPLPEEDKANPAEVRRLTLEVVRDFLESGLVHAGFPTVDGRGFTPWRLPPAEVLARINAGWDALGREPNIGDIVWFTTTAKGDKEVEGLVRN